MFDTYCIKSNVKDVRSIRSHGSHERGNTEILVTNTLDTKRW